MKAYYLLEEGDEIMAGDEMYTTVSIYGHFAWVECNWLSGTTFHANLHPVRRPITE